MLFVINDSRKYTYIEDRDDRLYYVVDTDDLVVNSISGAGLINSIENLGLNYNGVVKDEFGYAFDDNFMYMSNCDNIQLLNGNISVQGNSLMINGKDLSLSIREGEFTGNSYFKGDDCHCFYVYLGNQLIANSGAVIGNLDKLLYKDYFKFHLAYVFRLGNYIFVRYFVNTSYFDEGTYFIAVLNMNGTLIDLFCHEQIDNFIVEDSVCRNTKIRAKYETLVRWRY